MQLDVQWVIPILAAAAAWGGSRQALNGTRERVKEISSDLKDHVRWEADKYEHLTERVKAVEVKIDTVFGDE